MPDPRSTSDVRDILTQARTIAVVGAHPEATRAAHYVPAYLHDQGYRVLPVHPAFVGQTMFGQPVVATLAELDEPVDIVDVFRRSDAIPGHLDDILAMTPPPRVVWLQQGIRHDATAATLRAAGITVVQDRCTLADHRALGL